VALTSLGQFAPDAWTGTLGSFIPSTDGWSWTLGAWLTLMGLSMAWLIAFVRRSWATLGDPLPPHASGG
jgi:hypothetical protein